MLQAPVIMSEILEKRARETDTLNTYTRLIQDYSQYTILKTNPFTLHFNKQYIILRLNNHKIKLINSVFIFLLCYV